MLQYLGLALGWGTRNSTYGSGRLQQHKISASERKQLREMLDSDYQLYDVALQRLEEQKAIMAAMGG